MKQVSVVVPNLHSPIVGQTIASLCEQDDPGEYEVIVVGQDRYGQAQESQRVRHIVTPQPVSSAVARNIGIRAAQGEVIAFIDSDCLAAPDWLRRLSAHYTDSDVMVVGGGVRFPSTNYWTLCDNLSTFHEYLHTSPAGLREQLPSLNLSIRRAALDMVGMFDERYPLAAGEDADLTTRLRMHGYALHFDPRACVTHLPQRRSPASVFRHAYNFGRYSVKVDPRYQAYLNIRFPLRRAWSVRLFAPLLAGVVTAKILARGRLPLGHWLALPVLFGAKLAWCAGAARTLRHGSPFSGQA